jgi:hypothetical protein
VSNRDSTSQKELVISTEQKKKMRMIDESLAELKPARDLSLPLSITGREKREKFERFGTKSNGIFPHSSGALWMSVLLNVPLARRANLIAGDTEK